MAVHISVIKRRRQSMKRAARNQEVKSRIKTLVKKAKDVIKSRNRDSALVHLRMVNRTLDKAVSKGILKRTTASRRLSRLARSIDRLSATS